VDDGTDAIGNALKTIAGGMDEMARTPAFCRPLSPRNDRRHRRSFSND
jgi:hypothetical protein